MPKGMCWAEVKSNSEKIKPVSLAIVKLRLSDGINRSVGRLLARLVGRLVSWLVGRLIGTKFHRISTF